MAAIAADRNLLFGLLALQVGLIDQAQLVAAFHAWTLDKARALADHLIALGHLNDAERAVVEAMAALHVQKSGDVEQSLAAIPAGRSTREKLAGLGDPQINATLARVGSDSTELDADPDRTASYAVGTATSDGQRFRVLRPHARGGLGAIFVALDTELHREVALKQILDAHADDEASRRRFLVEAEITGGLEHPGIVPVYGLGTYGDGRPYYAMRFVRGDSLKEAIEHFHADEALKSDPGRHTLELRKLLRRFTDICNAIEYAHSRGVLHRDIKPGNVIVGQHGETLVVDWGLAKATGKSGPRAEERTLMPSSASGSAETLPGTALGTPAYMSPEQARGDLEHLGPRSDVYSLGATLYCLLTGRPPVENDDVGAVLRAVQRGEFPPPRRHDVAIDKALEAVCLKAMAHKPADRYASPKALADDLERWMADEPVTAWIEPLSRRARRWASRHRTAVTAAAAAVLVALAGAAAVLAVLAAGDAKLRAAYRELTGVNSKLGVANENVTRDFANALAEIGGLWQRVGQPAKAAAATRHAVALLERPHTRPPTDPYDLTCAHAMLAGLAAEPGSGMTADEGRAEAERAMQWLLRAVYGYDLRLVSPAVVDVGGIPTAGRSLIVVAAAKDGLHFRVFDADGQAVDTDETKLRSQAGPIAALRQQLQSLWPPHELTASEKAGVIAAAKSIVGHTPVDRGYRNIAFMQTDAALDPLRSRPDFQLLMMDLAFPAEPFARDYK